MKFRRTPQFKEDYEGLLEFDRLVVDSAFGSVAAALQGNVELYRLHKI